MIKVNHKRFKLGTPDKKEKVAITKKIFRHQQVLNEFLRAITLCNMDVELKMILRMRIWGKSPNIFAPMSHAAIALDLKCKESDVVRWEEDAIYNLKLFIDTMSTTEIKDKFESNKSVKDLMNPSSRIIV